MPRKSSASIAFQPVAAGQRLQPPDDLDGPARAVFLDIVLQSRPDFFVPTDVLLLSRYCRALIDEETAAVELSRAGFVGADGKPSGWLQVWQAKQRAVTTLARMLQLSPASRQSSPKPETPPPPSAYERIAHELRSRNNGTN